MVIRLALEIENINKSFATLNLQATRTFACSQTMAAPSPGWHYMLLYLTILQIIASACADGHTSEEERQKASRAANIRPQVCLSV